MKKTYHSNLMLKYKLGLLSAELARSIPNSTLYNWRRRDVSHIIGLPDIENADIDLMREFLQRKQLLKTAKAIYLIALSLQNLLDKAGLWKNQLRDYGEQIIETIDQTKEALGFRRVLKFFRIKSQTYYYQKNRKVCQHSVFKLCRLRHPLQLTTKEVMTVKQYLTDQHCLNWSLASVYYKMLRDKAAFMALGSFYKYTRVLKLQRQKPGHRREKHKEGIRAEKPLQILHADLTVFRPLDNTKVYIYFIADNFSRKILAWKASLEYSAKHTFENLQAVYREHADALSKTTPKFMVDDGSENQAEVNDFVEQHNIEKITAQKDIIFSNSMIEAVNKRVKYDFLFPAELQNFEQTVKQVEKAVAEYNDKPYHPLHGLTPNEVFAGKLPDKALFKQEIAAAKAKRIVQNKKNPCETH